LAQAAGWRSAPRSAERKDFLLARRNETSAMSGGPPDITNMVSLKIDCSEPQNLPNEWNKEDLSAIFEKHGEIGDLFIPRDRVTGGNRPFCFVRFYKEDDAEDAIKELDGYKLGGIPIVVAKAKKSREEAFASADNNRDDRGRGRSPYGGGRGRSPPRRRSPSRRRQRHDDSRSRSRGRGGRGGGGGGRTRRRDASDSRSPPRRRRR